MPVCATSASRPSRAGASTSSWRCPKTWLLVHLKMSGRLQIVPADTPANPHAHVVFGLDDEHELRFHDPRKFGRVYLVDEPDEVVGHLGPEPLAPAFTREAFAGRIAPRRGRLKPLLLDQAFVAGLGKHLRRRGAVAGSAASPTPPRTPLEADDVTRLHAAIVDVLARAVDLRDTSFSAGGYRDLTGNMGEMQGTLHVFRRTSEPCPRCGAPIERSVVAMRGTHVCPRCQVAPRRG